MAATVPGGRPLVCPRVSDLWYRAKLLPPEPGRIHLTLVAEVVVTKAEQVSSAASSAAGVASFPHSLPPSSSSAVSAAVASSVGEAVANRVMVAVATRTRLYLLRRDAIWLSADLGDVSVSVEAQRQGPKASSIHFEAASTRLQIRDRSAAAPLQQQQQQQLFQHRPGALEQALLLRGLSLSQRASLSVATEAVRAHRKPKA